jgi:hypothetical protein
MALAYVLATLWLLAIYVSYGYWLQAVNFIFFALLFTSIPLINHLGQFTTSRLILDFRHLNAD